MVTEDDLVNQRTGTVCRDKAAMALVALSLGLAVFPNLAMSYYFKDTLKLDLA